MIKSNRRGNPDHIDHASDMVKYINSFFQFNILEGKLMDQVFHSRAMLVNEELWHSVQETVFSLHKSNAAVLLYQMGLRYGISVGSKAREAKRTIHDAIKYLETYGLLAGWGKFSTSPVYVIDGKLAEDVMVTVKDNFFANARNGNARNGKSDGPRCFIIAGLLAGITEGLLGEGYSCIETICAASGATHCEFLITRRPD
jgi:predicted hydrocarbon binding protein